MKEGFNVTKACRHGTLLYNRNDAYVGRSLELYGEYSEGEVDLFRQFIHPGDTVIDAGANIGALTIPMAELVGPTGRVIAAEPQPQCYYALCANIALNSIQHVWPLPVALGNRIGSINVPLLDPAKPNNFGGLGLNPDSEGAVSIIHLDDITMVGVSFIKIDVEGMELDVLKGARETIRTSRPVLYVENLMKDRSETLVEFIERLEYNLWWHRPYLFNPDNFDGKKENVFDNIASHNMLCVPQESQADIQGLEKVGGA
jgi:FkbM family methyltransferase